VSIDISPAPNLTTFPSAPAGVSGQVAASAERSLQHLPENLLLAMVTGLRANADDLAPGVLFRGRDSGGCAVGVTLRQLAPDAFQFGRVEFWLWHRWRRGVEPDLARKFPQLQQLQRVFDDAVNELAEAGHDKPPAKAVGLWLAASAEAELRASKPRRSSRPATSTLRWSRRRVDQPPRGQFRTGISERARADMETPSCS
jgi:hypothetical protein